MAAAPHATGPAPCTTVSNAQRRFDSRTAFRPYTINQIAGAYGFNGLYAAGDLGAGATVALYELEGNFTADTTAYQTCFGTTGTVSRVAVDGGPPAPSAADDAGFETQIDIDNVIGLAPRANVIVYQGPDTGQGAFATDQAIVTADRASVLSQSWGLCEARLGGIGDRRRGDAVPGGGGPGHDRAGLIGRRGLGRVRRRGRFRQPRAGRRRPRLTAAGHRGRRHDACRR